MLIIKVGPARFDPVLHLLARAHLFLLDARYLHFAVGVVEDRGGSLRGRWLRLLLMVVKVGVWILHITEVWALQDLTPVGVLALSATRILAFLTQ